MFTIRSLIGLVMLAAPLSSLVQAQQAPPLSDLTFLPGDASPAPARGRQFLPRIAAGGDRFLVVWVDSRTELVDFGGFTGQGNRTGYGGSMMDIYAARLNADGSLIDQTPIVVAQGPKNQRLAEVAWNGESWLVVWTGETGIECCPAENRYAARVSWDGAVLDDPPILLAAYPDAEAAKPGALGSDGANWLFVWTGRSSSGSFLVRAMRIGGDGTILDPGGVVIAAGGYPGDFDVAFAGGEYFVIWSWGGLTSGGPVLGQRLMPDLTPIGPAVTINQYSPSSGLNCRVATNGTDYFVVWWEARSNYWSQVAGARVSHGGVVLDPDGIFLVAMEVGETTNFEPSVNWDGTNYIVAYQRSNPTPDDLYAVDLYTARVTTTGRVLDFDRDAITVSTAPQAQAEPDVAALPRDRSLIVWRDLRYTPPASGGYGDIFATTLSPGGALGTERCVSVGAPAQTLLKLVPNGTGYLAVYRSETSPETRIMAQRLDANGSALDLEPVTVFAGGIEVTNPSAAWNGSVYLVVWEIESRNTIASQIMGRRLSPDLAHLDPAPFAVLPGNAPDAAAVGDDFLTVSSWESPHEIRRIYCARVRGSDGAVLDPVPQGITASFSLYPRVAAFGSSWLVVWQQHVTHDDPWSQAMARFVGPGGEAGIVVGVDGNARTPAVTATADQAMVVFEGRTEPGYQRDIFARRLRPDGTYLDLDRDIAVTHELQPQFDPVVAWDGNRYVVAYSDFRVEGATTTPRGDLFGARVDAGVVLDPSGFTIAAETIPEIFPAAAGRDGASIVGASIFRPDAGLAAYRIGLRSFEVAAGIRDHADARVPRLTSTRPNPFNGGTTIGFDLPDRTAVTLRVVDVRGAVVRELFNGVKDAGGHEVGWDGTNDRGQTVASGVYFIRMQAGRLHDTAKLVVLK